jgi:1-acyl-sn-glycerol-3-phosphate acyltransferase
MVLYRFFRFLLRIFYRLIFRYEVIGHEHIPQRGAVLLCTNHISNLDPPLVGCSLKREVAFMAKNELFKIPVLSFLLRSFGAFPVKRGGADKQALKTGLTVLESGKVLGIFPEGTRSKTGELGPGFPGVGMFALKGDSSVIPVAIIGRYRPFQKMRVAIGQSIDFSDLKQEKMNSETMRRATERIMEHIQQLLQKYKREN